MRTTKISSGSFTKNGNFTAYNAKGERIFIHKATMESLGFTKDADLKKDNKFVPFFAIIGDKEINVRDSQTKEITTETTVRLQAFSIFLTQEDLIDAKNADAILEIESAKALNNVASSAGLTSEQVTALLNASI